MLEQEENINLLQKELISFQPEQIDPILQTAINEVIKPVSYDESKVQQWIDTICESCMKQLVELQKPLKYIVTCTIVQSTGAGFHTTHSSYWDLENDNVVQVIWPNPNSKDENNSHMVCVLTAIGMTL
mmetsp:Transcript_34399/g.41522  ORF Transcript_34399/g.41522 Transcript_34399/m.41522 type:complete len:128 (+) Transcript_34399:206-589(+)